MANSQNAEPYLASTEWNCPKAVELRQVFLKKFKPKKFNAKVKVCIGELNKLKKGLEELKSSCLQDSIKHLDSTVIPDPIIMKKLFDRIIEPEETSDQMSDENFFRMKRFGSLRRDGTVHIFFTPLFSVARVSVTSTKYLEYSHKTKAILLLLEIAQLHYWACRFYAGLGYARIAMLISLNMSENDCTAMKPLLLLRHATCHFVLVAISTLWTTQHKGCDCYKETVKVETSCQPILAALPATTDEVLQTDPCQPYSLKKLFADVLKVPNAYNFWNKDTSFHISVILVYIERMKIDVLKGEK